mmetsp:Transcript_5565/g.9727  ORF Transcript_5565/g.9727 Transcript_5565/m.9727 type:complete len:93 (+) Transcript_5565:2-280(+)
MTYQDSSTYVGRFDCRGYRSGRGTYTFPNGTVFLGEFKEDEMHSGVLTYPNGSRFVGQWKNRLRDGLGKEFRPDGSIRRIGTWQDGHFVQSS